VGTYDVVIYQIVSITTVPIFFFLWLSVIFYVAPFQGLNFWGPLPRALPCPGLHYVSTFQASFTLQPGVMKIVTNLA